MLHGITFNPCHLFEARLPRSHSLKTLRSHPFLQATGNADRRRYPESMQCSGERWASRTNDLPPQRGPYSCSVSTGSSNQQTRLLCLGHTSQLQLKHQEGKGGLWDARTADFKLLQAHVQSQNR